jgi:hypothetical protein
VAARVGASFRIASFAVRSRPPGTSGVGTAPEATIIDQWAADIETAGRAALDRVGRQAAVPAQLEAVIGYGHTWEEALEDVEWDEGDVLVVGVERQRARRAGVSRVAGRQDRAQLAGPGRAAAERHRGRDRRSGHAGYLFRLSSRISALPSSGSRVIQSR